MIFRCPYCQAPLTDQLAIPPLSKRRKRIYDAVVEAGHTGIPAPELVVAMYAPEEDLTPGAYVMMRVHIHEMNKTLASVKQKIVSKPYGAYRLISTQGDYNGEATQEPAAQADYRTNPQNKDKEQ